MECNNNLEEDGVGWEYGILYTNKKTFMEENRCDLCPEAKQIICKTLIHFDKVFMIKEEQKEKARVGRCLNITNE